jgi:hypothetical protein
MLESGVELITLDHGLNYEPTFVSTDKRVPSYQKTSLGYYQVGELQQYGFAKGPIFKIELVDVASAGTGVTHIKIWGIDNLDNTAPIYPIAYFTKFPIIHVYLKKFEFCDSDGVEVVPDGEYTIVGYKKKGMLSVW